MIFLHQKLRNSVRSDLEDCPSCNSFHHNHGDKHHGEVQLVVYSPQQDNLDKPVLMTNEKNDTGDSKLNGLNALG